MDGEARTEGTISVRVETLDPRGLRLLDRNARYMTAEQRARLTENIKADGALTSVPFCCRDDDGEWLVLSGNHRVRAAIDAGLDAIPVLVTDDALSHDRRVAIQLSHNSIVGQDDIATLVALYESLGSVDARAYSGLDDAILNALDKPAPAPISESSLDFRIVTFLLLPNEVERAAAALDQADSMIASDEVWAARAEDFERLMAALEAAGKAGNVRNRAAQLGIVLDVFERHAHELTPEAAESSTE
jgi:ParB-like chromosome segregation protein Spo0J